MSDHGQAANGLSRHPHQLSERLVERQLVRRQRTVNQFAVHPAMSSDTLEIAVRDGVALAAVVSLADATDLRVIDGLRASARAGAGLFAALGASTAIEVEFRMNEPRTLPPIQTDGNTNSRTWRRAFFAALCVGDCYALDRLSAADVDLIRASPVTSGELLYTEIEALAALHHRDADTADRLLAALKQTDPAVVEPDFRDFVLDVVVFEIELFFRAIAGDAAAFNASLTKALTRHRHYYGRGERARDPMGQLALGLLGAACFANDRGIEVTVESDYIPRAVIEYPRPG